ncbi:MAG TPA: hypothetical protein VF176_00635 [Solirubrobacterales bacterium]
MFQAVEADAKRALDRGSLRAPAATTVREAADAWVAGAEVGEILNGKGQPYKPATLRGYRQALKDRVLPVLGQHKLAVTTSDLQELVDQWVGEGPALWWPPSRTMTAPVGHGPLRGPAVRRASGAAVAERRPGGRDDPRDRAGTRRMAAIAPKTATSRRSTPIPEALRDALVEHRLRIAAGVNAKALSAFMGHSSIKVTFDLYGHLMRGAETEATARPDAFLAVPTQTQIPSGGSDTIAADGQRTHGLRGAKWGLHHAAPGVADEQRRVPSIRWPR